VKIALFHTTLPEPGRKPGGVEVAVHHLAEALARAGDDVTVHSLTAAPAGARYRHRHRFRATPWLGRWIPARLVLLPLALNAIDFGDADIVHFHGDDWFYLRRRRQATVRTFHGTARREASAATRPKVRLMYIAVGPLERLSARLADRVLAIGADAAARFDTPHVVTNGVDLDRFHPGPKTPCPTVLFVGTWDGRKRGRLVYRAFVGTIAARFPSARLVMVSDRCPAHPRVDHVPRPDDDELAALYRSAWALAHPSLYEGFGIPYLEAMASGTAIVTSPNEGAAFVLEHGRFGRIAPDHAFGAELAALIADGDTRRELEAAGLEHVRGFSWSRVAAAHRQHYVAVVAHRGLARRRKPGSPARTRS